VLTLAVAGAVPVAFSAFDWGALAFVLIMAATVGLSRLPRWRDPKHGPIAGAMVLCAGAAAISLSAYLIAKL
jgi:hypothetical protein